MKAFTLHTLIFSLANDCAARACTEYALDRAWPSGLIHRRLTVAWQDREYGRAQFRHS